MDILGQLLQGATGSAASGSDQPQIDTASLAGQFGLSPAQANLVVGALLPAVLGGIKRAEQGGTLDQVAAMAGTIGQPTQGNDGGNTILGHIFGSRDVSRQVAAQASQHTGISETILRAMLPVVAGLVAQQVARRIGGGTLGGVAGSILGSIMGAQAGNTAAPAPSIPGGGGLGGLIAALDNDHDGNPLDDILGMVRGR